MMLDAVINLSGEPSFPCRRESRKPLLDAREPALAKVGAGVTNYSTC
jgi:hypothetical protein